MRRNHLLLGMSLRKIHDAHHHRVSRNSRVPRPTITSHARWTTLTSWSVGRSAAGVSSSPWMTVDVPVLGSDNHEARPGIGRPPTTSPFGVEMAEKHLGHVAAGLGHHLDRGELGGLVVEDPAGQCVADAHLHRCRDGGDGEADDEAHPVVAVGAAPQHPDRVDGRDHEAADEVRRHHHVGGHQRHGVVEDDAHRVDVGHVAGRVEGDALGGVHPGVGRHHRDAAEDARRSRWARRSRSGPRASAGASRRCRSR